MGMLRTERIHHLGIMGIVAATKKRPRAITSVPCRCHQPADIAAAAGRDDLGCFVFSKFTAALPPSDLDGVGRKAGARHKAYFEFLATKWSFSGATGQECKMRLYVKSRGYRDLPASAGLVTCGSAAASCRSASNLLKRLE
jgi:hypothetical protein